MEKGGSRPSYFKSACATAFLFSLLTLLCNAVMADFGEATAYLEREIGASIEASRLGLGREIELGRAEYARDVGIDIDGLNALDNAMERDLNNYIERLEQYKEVLRRERFDVELPGFTDDYTYEPTERDIQELIDRVNNLQRMAREAIAVKRLLDRLDEIQGLIERLSSQCDPRRRLDDLIHELQGVQGALERPGRAAYYGGDLPRTGVTIEGLRVPPPGEPRDPRVTHVSPLLIAALPPFERQMITLLTKVHGLKLDAREAARGCRTKRAEKARDAIIGGTPQDKRIDIYPWPKDGIEFVEHNPCRDKQAAPISQR